MSALDAQAANLMDLVTTPSALVTGTFLAFAGRAIKENQDKAERSRMWFATLASVAAIGVTCALSVLMAPIAFQGVSQLSPTLVVYGMIFLSVVGTAIFRIWILTGCVKELRRAYRL
jgi:hypothetical protein